MALTVAPSTSSDIAIAPNKLDSLNLANYSVSRAGDGGWIYSYNGAPITRENYTASTGLAAQVDPTAAGGATATSGPRLNADGSTYQDKTNDISQQNAGLGGEAGIRDTGLAGVDKTLAGIRGQYADEAASNEKTYGDQSDSNQNSLQKNKETSLVNAAQGRRGLFGTLASLGALNGSGIDLANKAVATGANADLSAAGDTYAGNATMLDSSIGKFREDDKRRNADAVTAADNAKGNIRNDSAKRTQDYYKNLSNDYTAQGDTAQAADYTGRANAMFPEISATSLPSGGPSHQNAAFTPGSLASYLTGANSTQVSTTPDTVGGAGLPGLVAANIKRKTA